MSESESGPRDPVAGRPPLDRLDSWKAIAAYLGRDIRTVQRWEKLEGLPVHRHVHQQRGSAFAYRGEIDSWYTTRRHDLQHPPQSGVVDESGEHEQAATTDGPLPRDRRVRRTVWIGVSAAVAAALLLLTVALSRQATPSGFQATHHRLLSDFPGGAGGASFSPDGSMIAFHRGDVDDVGPLGNFQIWVKNVSGGRPL